MYFCKGIFLGRLYGNYIKSDIIKNPLMLLDTGMYLQNLNI